MNSFLTIAVGGYDQGTTIFLSSWQHEISCAKINTFDQLNRVFLMILNAYWLMWLKLN